jgi:hypothetical protein
LAYKTTVEGAPAPPRKVKVALVAPSTKLTNLSFEPAGPAVHWMPPPEPLDMAS